MKIRLLLGLLAVVGLLSLTVLVRGDFENEQLALLIKNLKSELDTQICVDALQAVYQTTLHQDEFVFTPTDLNNDGSEDYIVRIENDTICGTAGCTYELCVTKNESFEHISLGIAAINIEPKFTLTNGMKDLMVNDDPNTLLTWDGVRYILAQP